jgi:hypothetical protein
MKIKIYETVISHVLHGCAAWFLTFTEEHWLRVFEIRVLRAIHGRIRKLIESVISMTFS